MKYKFLLLILLILPGISQAQILKPAKWSYATSKEQVKINDEVELIFNVKIDEDWYLYSSDFDPDLGPMVTEFTFQPNSSYELVGDIKPINPKKKYDELWEGEYTYFENTGQFRQVVKVLKEDLIINGSVEYQVCTDVDGRCIPFEEEYSFSDITVASRTAGSEQGLSSAPGDRSEKITEEVPDEVPSVLDDTASLEDKAPEPLEIRPDQENQTKTELTSNMLYTPEIEANSLWSFMLLAFLAGLAALITPCVFPMIPMTVTFFTTSSKNRNKAIIKAIVYGLSIIAIYTLAGTIVSRFNGPEFANWLSTHWLPNLIFFAIFIIFGLSFLGLFEITLPSSIINKVDQEADKGGYYGTLFMAFTIVLVSFSCTGPIVGSILVESAGGAIVKPIAGMFSFSLAFAIPFTLFAIFPDWLKNLPKSGGWLNSVKVVLGFLELALALKFLSIADQVYHWNILDREVFLAIWIAIFSLLGLYLLGKIRLPHDGELKFVSVPRLMLALITFSFIVYLVPGLFGAPLKSLAGFLPPMSTQDFNLRGMVAQSAGDPEYTICEEPNNPANLKFPHGIKGYFELEQAVACAREQNKPIFIDFTGHGCVNCRKMEERVWSEPEVLSRLKNDFIMVALYVDEKTVLPESEWYTSSYDGKIKKTIGGQNADLQITRYQNNAQPFYLILGLNEEVLLPPVAYETNVQKFVDFLDRGLNNFRSVTASVSGIETTVADSK